MKKSIGKILVLTLLVLPFTSTAQITINPTIDTAQLMQALIGSGLSISNVTLNCPQTAYATFNNGNTTNLGINSGIILSTGSASGIAPGNTSTDFCFDLNSSTDPDLVLIEPLAGFDICTLEFDIFPRCDSLSIRFVFASDEYPEFVNGGFNDAFGFFISGLNPAGGNYTSQNIAVIPGGTPVSIDNINNGSTNTGPCMNCAYYIDNSALTSIVFDGMTVVITSSIALVPCTPYRFKLAIADAGDCALTSGVFVDFIDCSTAFTTSPTSTPDGCNTCTGTAAVNVQGGVGPFTYQWLPTGGTGPTASNLCAGTYSVLVSDAVSCNIPDTVIINVDGQSNVSVTTQKTDASCARECDGSFVITPTNSSSLYTYSWTPNVSNTNSADNLCSGNYSVAVADASGCPTTFTVNIAQVVPPNLFNADSLVNIFTPNGDGKNDFFYPYYDISLVGQSGGTSQPAYDFSQLFIRSFEIKIYNRWGKEVFSSNDFNIGWDGTDNGSKGAEGVYYWIAQYTSLCKPEAEQEAQVQTGFVHLMR